MFKTFAAAVGKRLTDLSKVELYTVDVTDLFATYLAAFPVGTDPLFRVRTEHDGNYDKSFVRRFGVVVAIDDQLNRQTIWDVADDVPYPYDVVAKALHDVVMQAPITGLFRTKEPNYGHKPNADNHDPKILWTHFYGEVANQHKSRQPDKDRGDASTTAQVFKRGLTELKSAAFETVIDLIDSKSIYRGAEFRTSVVEFQKLIRMYEAAPDQTAFIWANITKPQARFRNTAIGTLLTDLSDGEELEVAVKKFESKVAPENYKRTSALITPAMAEKAVGKLKELGLENAIHRRYAHLSDVSINNVLWADRVKQTEMKDALLELLVPATGTGSVDVKNAELITMDDFLRQVLPSSTAMELLLQNRHQANFVSLTTSDDPARLFQWDNPFAWSYDGEVTDSLREKVKRAGGKTDVPLRVSLGWHNSDDLDLAVDCPEGHVYFGNKAGILDVDMNAGGRMNSTDPVENLSWTRPRNGEYAVTVTQFTKRGTKNPGFTIELWANGESRMYEYANEVNAGFRNVLLTYTVKDGVVSNITPSKLLRQTSGGQDKWGVKTETLVPVDTLMLSPNWWDGQTGKGNQHWFFFLRGCTNPDATRGIYNEFLRADLNEHRKVFEVLGSKTKCQPDPKGLSGLGYSSTRGDDAIVVVTKDGKRRAYNIVF